jgi:MFS transporter, DHA2 family, multidrug resistance protein
MSAGDTTQLSLTSAEDWRPRHAPWLIAFTVMTSTFMEVLDTSIANVSLPNIAGNLSAGIDESTWVLTSYLVSNAIILPLSGWLGSLFGRKRFYMVCVTIFVVSSFLCGLAPSLGWLVFFRVLQGAGGGSMQPISQAILVESFPRSKRGMAMAVYAMGVVVAPIVGPTVGGWITDNYTWRWIFFINIPVGAISLLLSAAFVEDPPYLIRKNLRTLKIDYVGLGLLSVGLGSLQIMLDKGQRDDWLESHLIAALLVVAVVCLFAVVVWELRQPEPVVDLHLLKDRNFLVAVVTMFILGFILYGSMALLPIFLQTLMGYTAMLSGLVLSPGGLVTLIVLPIVGRLLGRFEARWLVIIGVVVTATSMFQMSAFNLQTDFWTIVMARNLTGAGLAFLFVPINTMAFYFVPRNRMNYGTGLINLARNVGGSCGIAFVTTVLARGAQIHQNTLAAHLSPVNPVYLADSQGAAAALGQGGSGAVQAAQQAQGMLYGMVQQQAAMLSFVDNFQMLGLLFLFLIPLMFLIKKAPPHAMEPLAAH